MKSAKQIQKEVRALKTTEEQQKYIDALSEREAIAFFHLLLLLD